MPEGDTIYKLAAALRPELEGQRVEALVLRGAPPLAPPRRIAAVEARGKHLLIRFDDGRVLRSHLGMHGDWHRYAKGELWRKPQRQASIRLETEQAVYVCFNAREWQWLQAGGIDERTLDTRLRHDLLAGSFDVDAAVERARQLLEPETPLVDVLLDQRVAAGIGNVYKSELLFLERRDPLQPLLHTGDDVLRRMLLRGRQLLQANLGGGPRITRDNTDGGGRLWVYGRSGKACFECGANIRSAKSGKHLRATFWCPNCQSSEERRD